MGFSIPKLPMFNKAPKKLKVVNPSASGGLSSAIGFKNKIMVKRQPTVMDVPPWAEWEDGYGRMAYDMGYPDPMVVVVVYKTLPGNLKTYDDGFYRIYILDKDNATPVPYIKSMWKSLHKVSKNYTAKNYTIDEEGRTRHLMMSVPLDTNDTLEAIRDLVNMDVGWRKFPNVTDFDTVKKLIDAEQAIKALKNEEEYNWLANKIKTCQDNIKSEQEQISVLEKNLNTLYEQAADAMNLFEENGLDPNAIGSEGERKAHTIADLDVGSLYPIKIGLSYKGSARITPIPNSTNGEVKVSLIGGPSQCSAGDLVHDFVTNKMAVCLDGKKWVSTN